ncbi:MAG: hypothetical protein ACXV9R_08150 [Methylobacter sp.]
MSNVVFFQKNSIVSSHGSVIAWRVARHCGYRNYCYIPYSWDTTINMVDWHANHSERQTAAQGDIFHIDRHRYGKRLSIMAQKGHPTEIEVQNCLSKGAMHVNLYRSGGLVARHPNVIPQQRVKFDIQHRLYVAVMPEVKQGTAIPEQLLSTPALEIYLHGIVSADIVMQGGGPGNDAKALNFKMANVVSY